MSIRAKHRKEAEDCISRAIRSNELAQRRLRERRRFLESALKRTRALRLEKEAEGGS